MSDEKTALFLDQKHIDKYRKTFEAPKSYWSELFYPSTNSKYKIYTNASIFTFLSGIFGSSSGIFIIGELSSVVSWDEPKSQFCEILISGFGYDFSVLWVE